MRTPNDHNTPENVLYHFGPNRYRFAHHFESHLATLEVRG